MRFETLDVLGRLRQEPEEMLTIHVTKGHLAGWPLLYLYDFNGGRAGARTPDLLRVKQAL